MSMYVLSQTSLRYLIASASSAVAPSGTTSSRLVGDQKRFQIDAAARECESGLIAPELTRGRSQKRHESAAGLNRRRAGELPLSFNCGKDEAREVAQVPSLIATLQEEMERDRTSGSPGGCIEMEKSRALFPRGRWITLWITR